MAFSYSSRFYFNFSLVVVCLYLTLIILGITDKMALCHLQIPPAKDLHSYNPCNFTMRGVNKAVILGNSLETCSVDLKTDSIYPENFKVDVNGIMKNSDLMYYHTSPTRNKQYHVFNQRAGSCKSTYLGIAPHKTIRLLLRGDLNLTLNTVRGWSTPLCIDFNSKYCKNRNANNEVCSSHVYDERILLDCQTTYSCPKGHSCINCPDSSLHPHKNLLTVFLNNEKNNSDISIRTNLEQIVQSNLTILDLRGYNNESLNNDTFKGLVTLKSLSLCETNVKLLKVGTFADLRNLKSLDLSDNKLRYLVAGTFNGLINLASLRLANNELRSIKIGTFNGLTNLLSLILSGNQLHCIEVGTFKDLNHLRILDLRFHDLTELQVGVFEGLRNLHILDLNSNKIYRSSNQLVLTVDVFADLSNLTSLNLGRNSIVSLEPGVFSGLINLESLDLSSNSLENVTPETFRGLSKLNILDISYNYYLLITDELFSYLPTLITIHTFTEICDCLFNKNQNNSEFECIEEGIISQYASCRLLGNSAITTFMMLFGIIAVLGNVFVLLWRMHQKQQDSHVQYILLSNLAVSDLLMGIYMIIIASADIFYSRNYISNSFDWRCSPSCLLGGVLAFVSCEASVFFITLISIDRFINIRYPFTTRKLRTKSAKICVSLFWILAFVLGFAPYVFPILLCRIGEGAHDLHGYNTFYDVTDLCIGLPLARSMHKDISDTHMHYSIAVFLGLNLVCFLIILVCYIEIIRKVKMSSKRARSSANMQRQIRLTVKVAAIVGTDFLCWFPIILVSIIGQSDLYTVDVRAYALMTTFVLPINSTINPFLYTIAHEINKRRKQKQTNGNLNDVPLQVQNHVQNHH